MFKRKDKSHEPKLGLAISSPIATIKNNSEILYIADSKMSASSSAAQSARTSYNNSPNLASSDDDFSNRFHIPSNSPFKQNYTISKPMTPPDESENDYRPQSKSKYYRRSDDSLSSSRRPSYQPSLTNKLDDLKLVNYIDLNSSFSTVQMIATTGRLPPWLQRCSNLQYLVAKDLGITIVDDWVSLYLTNLKVVRLNNNQIATWPDHLSRLIPDGKLEVLDLEGNPCLTTMFSKSSAFKSLYIEAALSSDTDNGDHSNELLLKRTRSSASSSKSLHTSVKQPSLFKKATRQSDDISEDENDDSDDDDMLTSLQPKALPMPTLRKHSSSAGLFSSFVNNKNLHILKSSKKSESAPVSMLPSPEIGGGPESPTDLKSINQSYTKTDVAKSRVILSLLQDIYELSTRTVVRSGVHKDSTTPKQFRVSTSSTCSSVVSYASSRVNSLMNTPTTELSISLPQHARLNSLDVLHHYLDEFNLENQNAINSKVDSSTLIPRLAEFIEEEKNYISKLNNFAEIYYLSKAKELKKAEILFKQFPEVLHFHENIVLRTLNISLERVQKGQDPNLEFFTQSLLSIMSSLELVYIAFARVIENAKRQARFWLKLFKQSYASSSMYYGATYGGYVPSQHPDCDIGEWLRACSKNKNTLLPSVMDYLQLPLSRLESFKTFFKSTSALFPSTELIHTRLESISHEVKAVVPLQVRAARLVDIKKLFKFPSTDYGNYICDSNVIIQCKVSLNEVNIAKGKTGDVMYQSTASSEKNTPRYADFQFNNITKPPKGDVFRMVVLEEAVLIIHEAKRNVSRVLMRKDIHASYPWKQDTLIDASMSATPKNTFALKPVITNSTLSSSTTPTTDQRTALQKCFRLALHDTSELWYILIRTFTGDAVGGSLAETRTELINAITPQC